MDAGRGQGREGGRGRGEGAKRELYLELGADLKAHRTTGLPPLCASRFPPHLRVFAPGGEGEQKPPSLFLVRNRPAHGLHPRFVVASIWVDNGGGGGQKGMDRGRATSLCEVGSLTNNSGPNGHEALRT